MLPSKGAAKCQPVKHLLLVTYFNSVLVIRAFELVPNRDKFIYYIAEVVLLHVSFPVCSFSLSLELKSVILNWTKSNISVIRVILTNCQHSFTLYI